MQPQPKVFKLDQEMRRDFEDIQKEFKNKFGLIPSNSSIFSLLLETYKQSKAEIKRKPKSKKQFLIKF